MLTKEEQKAIREKAYGRRISFHTRYHWILTWLEEQPGKNLADKVWGVVDRAYRADYLARARRAESRYCRTGDFNEKVSALCDAMECYGRAGDEERRTHIHTILTHILWERERA